MTPIRLDPRLLALEHVAWCLKEGITLGELHAALGPEAGPRWKCWEDAIARLQRVASDMNLYLDARQLRQQKRVQQRDLPPPYRRREPPPVAWRACLCANVCNQGKLSGDRYCRLESRPKRRVA